jgi:uncharacterized membrane-anchored protein YitT (DUF2179 family)
MNFHHQIENARRRTARTQAPVPVRHSIFEDVYAIVTGCSFVVLGLVLLKSAGLVTGGIAGLALLFSYVAPVPAGVLFTLLNIPFMIIAWWTMGRAFVVKAVIANLTISIFAIAFSQVFEVGRVNSLFAALFGGTVVGVGILQLARHHVGVGGLGILALSLHKSRGWNAGNVQLAGDALVLLTAIPALGIGAGRFIVSVASAVAVSGVLMIFHKPGRYTGY